MSLGSRIGSQHVALMWLQWTATALTGLFLCLASRSVAAGSAGRCGSNGRLCCRNAATMSAVQQMLLQAAQQGRDSSRCCCRAACSSWMSSSLSRWRQLVWCSQHLPFCIVYSNVLCGR
ncbi:hypothetical protein COO60DRAFT_1531672 [Scenedesmus sp. NREL 46B-D3]|nr:hypothetical protein COO60DRAFT_1531672 [Scenedesmus sp. NREL 46B-D3]